MFCADYIAAFVYHAIMTIGTISYFGGIREDKAMNTNVKDSNDNEVSNKETTDSDIKITLSRIMVLALGLHVNNVNFITSPKNLKDSEIDHQMKESQLNNFSQDHMGDRKVVVIPFGIGLASGLAASASLYPFDFVRSGVLKPGLKRLMSAASTVPYAGSLFGIYFCFRDPNSIKSQMKWAAGASTCAILAEIPFDHAKRTMLGSTRVMLGAGLLYVPFASLMLVMYDKAAIKLVTPFLYPGERIS